MEEQIFSFGPYRLGGPHGPLLRDTEEVKLTPQALAVLWLLVSRAGQIVTKEELLQTVWAGTVVSDEALTTCLRRLRRALGESAEQPRYIATVHRIGYRFIAPLSPTPPVISNQLSVVSSEEARGWRLETSPSSPQASSLQPLASSLVGREAELAQLHSLFVKTVNGERQIVFVTGEAGIGKTALVDAFIQSLASSVQRQNTANGRGPKSEPVPSLQPLAPGWRVAVGQCIEHYGAGEAYLPLLDALGGLCRQAEGEQVVEVLRRVAPTWLVQLPALLTESDYAALQQKMAGTTRERMLREVVEALEVLSREQVLVLVLEDVHWSDAPTIEVLNLLARRRELARLLVMATYRPTEVIVSEHPLKRVKQELVTRGQGVEVVLGRLDAASVAYYVQQRWTGGAQQPVTAAAAVYRRTEGHPLFMVQVVDYLTQRDQATWHSEALEEVELLLPQQLRQLLEVQLEQLTAQEQQVLEVGSVAGVEFTVASVAAGMGNDETTVETICEALVQRGQFIVEREVETWPDGTVSGCYGFRHALYQEVLYQRMSASRLVRLHRQIGLREETGYGERVQEHAAELAMHFERGHDYPRTVHYLQQAAETALRRYAYQEAQLYLDKELSLLRQLPTTLERDRQELTLQFALATALRATAGFAAGVVGAAYRRAVELARQLEEWMVLLRAARGLHQYLMVEADLPAALTLAQQSVEVAQRVNAAAALVETHSQVGAAAFWLGDFAAARHSLEHSCTLYESSWSASLTHLYDEDVRADTLSFLSWTLWFLGYPDQAVQMSQAALTHARNVAHPYSLTFALYFAARVYQLRGEAWAMQQVLDELQELSQRHGFVFWRVLTEIARGWIAAETGDPASGISQFRAGLQSYMSTGAGLGQSYQTPLLAEMYGKTGAPEEGITILAEAETFAQRTGEGHYAAERYRLQGELLLVQERKAQRAEGRGQGERNTEVKMRRGKGEKRQPEGGTPQSAMHSPQLAAEACFLKAIEIAQQQHAKSLELRAVMSLVRLRQQQAREQRAESKEQGATNETAGKRGREDARTPEKRSSLPASQHSSARFLEAHRMLSEVYAWFTEGVDTRDLQEAKALLEELRS